MHTDRFLINLLAFPLRVLVAFVCFFFFAFESTADILVGARRATQYKRIGSCVRCGRCCKLLALEVPKAFLRFPFLLRLFGVWHDIAFNFEPQGSIDRYLVYRCRYYRDNEVHHHSRCSIHPFRHRICRFFPRQRLYGHPELAPECGFRFVRRQPLTSRGAVPEKSFQEHLQEQRFRKDD